MKLGNYPLSRQDNIVIQEFDNEILIYDLTKNKACCLNKTSAMIWQACDGEKSVAEISQILSKKQKINVSEDIVWLALNQFKKDDLLTESADIVTPFDGLSRREIVKRIGFASMVAIPLISSVIAPSAARAASFGLAFCDSPQNQPAGCPCVGNIDCIPGCFCPAQGTMTCCGV